MKKILLFVLCAAISQATFAQKKKKGKEEPPKPAASKTVSIADKTKTCKKTDGLFPLYQDTVTGNLFILVNKNKIGKEFIYFSYTENGVLSAGHFKGSFRDNKVFTIKKYFDRVEFVVKNTEFYFDPASELSKAQDANISPATLVSQKPVAENTETGDMLLDANTIFLSEAFSQVKPSPMPPPFQSMQLLGMLNKEKSKYVNLRNYPQNTDIVVEYVYDNPAPTFGGGKEVTDPRSVSIVLQHSLIEAPETPMPVRLDDPRIGFFTEQVNDMTTPEAINYRDAIHRWRLEKKDKNAEVSEPVKPIVWWIEKTTPKEFRGIIKEAGLRWNLAFEKAGFKDAVQIEEQPDTATWDAGDIRYNVIRWTSSPQPPFGGYGPSFVDPRTGEILGADIMLEYIFVTNRLLQENYFDAAPLSQPQLADKYFCSAGTHLHSSAMFGMSVLNARGLSEFEKREYMKQSLYYLVLHEMGHTMGLMHNMKASQLWNPTQAHNKALTQEKGLIASVMDYPAANVALDKNKQGDYFTSRPGPYDLWAIEYGYSEGATDEREEKERLKRILDRSTDSTLIFGNDADDMRSPGKAIDPRVNINDFSNDAIAFSIDRIKLVNQVLPKLKDKYTKNGASYQELRQAFSLANNELFNATATLSRYIGGVYVDRSFAGQGSPNKPFTPVDYKDQKRAMQALNTYLFSPAALSAPADLYNYLQNQRRGFDFFVSAEDPKLHDRSLAIQGNVLDHLLHQNTLKRLTDSRLYGNKYSALEMMTDLTNACFKEDLAGNVNTFRQNLQVEYVKRLARIISKTTPVNYDNVAKSAALAQLKSIKRMFATPAATPEITAHRDHIVLLIDQAMAKD